MDKEKEFPIIISDEHKIKLFEESQKITTPLASEFVIFKCPLNCDNCKTIYSNKLTGIKIVCKCSCHVNTISKKD